ncbi:MAG: hypothetical protein OHK0039_26290 [Bacteroidia bacterium]
MKITRHTQEKLQDLLKTQGYSIRYEKGSFKGGYCIVQAQKMIIVNKFHPLESKVNTLIEILREIEIDEAALSPEQAKWIERIRTEQEVE